MPWAVVPGGVLPESANFHHANTQPISKAKATNENIPPRERRAAAVGIGSGVCAPLRFFAMRRFKWRISPHVEPASHLAAVGFQPPQQPPHIPLRLSVV